MKRLIVNADDFGQDEDTLTRTIEGFELGKITSATIMAGMPKTARAVAYAKKHPQYSFGVHPCLVDEKPMDSRGSGTSEYVAVNMSFFSVRFLLRP